jgi:pyridoxamine 5'-phosphate oxidase
MSEGLSEADVHPDPFVQFDRWYDEAARSGNPQPDAMALATATQEGRPSVRMVLLKGRDARGLVFYTNRESQKGREISANPYAAIVLYWVELHRQVRASGDVERLSPAETERYFKTRPRDAQISALASSQSATIASREDLERRVAELRERHEGADVPMPVAWSGFRLRPDVFEFWQGRPTRLHDRLRYTRTADGDWRVERLQP